MGRACCVAFICTALCFASQGAVEYSHIDLPEESVHNVFHDVEDGVEEVELGFRFPFYGKSYVRAFLTTNGFLSFSPVECEFACAFNAAPIPSLSKPNNIIAFLMGNMYKGGYTYGTTQTEGSKKVFVLNMNKASPFADNGVTISLQLQLHEDGGVWLEIGKISGTATRLLEAHYIGTEDERGEKGAQVVAVDRPQLGDLAGTTHVLIDV